MGGGRGSTDGTWTSPPGGEEFSGDGNPKDVFWLVGSIKLQVSFAKELYRKDNILQQRPLLRGWQSEGCLLVSRIDKITRLFCKRSL